MRQRIIYFGLKKEQKAPAFGQILKTGPIVLAAILATLTATQRAGVTGVKARMSTGKFEPYGEPLPEAGSGDQQPNAASAILSAVGQYSFWLLVVVIVVTRIWYFSPASLFPANAVSALTHNTQR